MLSLPDIDLSLLPWLTAGACILFRLAGVLMAMPFARQGRLPQRMRAIFAFYLTVAFVFGLGFPLLAPPETIGGWLALLLPEVLLGVAMGLIVRVLLGAAEAMGQLASTTVGLSFATFVDPSTGSQTDVLGRLLALLAGLVFVLIDGHHVVFGALFESFQTLPVGTANLSAIARGSYSIAELGAHLFLLSLRLAAPVLAG